MAKLRRAIALLIPLAHNSKKPLAGSDWHDRSFDNPLIHEQWIEKGLNVGILMEENRRVVVDFGEKSAGQEFMRRYPDLATVVVETRRGFHFHFSGKTNTRKFMCGDINGNGYVAYPPSIVDGYEYKFLKEGELQPFPDSLFLPMVST